jgi:peptide deformylase
MKREILIYPNPILRKKSVDVTEFDNTLHTLLDDMYDTMIDKGGVGLAAVQIGVLKNILIINLPDEEDIQHKDDLIEAINPIITHREGDLMFKEGCLSVPGFHEEVNRYKKITVSYQDRYGNNKQMECEDFLAVAWQHEIEHLKGHIFIEKLSYLKRKKFEKEYKKQLKKRK